MASNYPSGLDSLSNPAGTDALSTGHAAQHGNANDAIEAIEGELGTDPAGASATVKDRFDVIEANSWVTSARIADGTITGTDIASGTVTSANIADGTIANADISGTAAIDKTKISGTAITAADSGTVTSTMIADGTIVNADVNASAAIAATKVAGIAVTQADSGTVTSAMIADGTIVNADIATAAAVAPSKIDQARVTFSNAPAVCAATTRKLAQVGTMSASRTVTLPAANAVDAGTEIVICDESGSVTSTNTIVIARAGSDTINGTTSVSIGAAYGMRRVISDGTSKWTLDGGVVRTSDTGTVTSTMIADATITGTDIASGTVTSTNILDATITGSDIASGTITSTNILDGTILNADINAAAAIDISKISGGVTSALVGNMLTSNQATVETDLVGFGVHASTTTTQSNEQAWQGTYSAKIVATGSGAVNLCAPTAGTKTVPVTPGQVYTASAMVYQGTGTRITSLSIYWYQSNGSTLVTVKSSADLTAGAAWTRLMVTGVAPALAAYARIYVNIAAGSANDVMYVDGLGFWAGAGGEWAAPGTAITNLGQYTDTSVGRRQFQWNEVDKNWQQVYGDTGVREGALSLSNGWTVYAGVDRLSRIGNVVYWEGFYDSTSASSDTFTTIPAGFRPSYNVLFPVMVSGTTPHVVFVEGTGVVTMTRNGIPGQQGWHVNASWRTPDAWPTSLPGSASGSIPLD